MKSKITVPDVIRRSCLISRFAGEEIMGHRMTIAEHHFEVVSYVIYILDMLAINSKVQITPETYNMCVRLALVHDIPEIYTGDIPTPAKYAIESFKGILDELEELVIDEVLPDHIGHQFEITNGDTTAAIVVKCADIMAVTREIIDEQKRGNHISSDLNFIDNALTRLSEKFSINSNGNDWECNLFNECKLIITNFIGQIYA